MSREAAIAGCCVVTDRLGEVKVPKLSLFPTFKINGFCSDFVREFGRTISDVIEFFEGDSEYLNDYHAKVGTENSDFMDQVASIC
jgi:hypothetical protein